MDKATKILCVCQKGETRSAGTRRRLNRRGYGNVVAIGIDKMAVETLDMLSNWADLILVAEPRYNEFLPPSATAKISPQFTLGKDVWGNPRNNELQERIKQQLNALGLQ